DTGVIQGISQAPESVSFEAMAERQQQLADVILRDPAVESISSFIGVDGVNTTLNSGRIAINLKPLDKRNINAAGIIQRLRKNLNSSSGFPLTMHRAQTITGDTRASRSQYQFTLEDPDAADLDPWTSRFLAKLDQLPELSGVASDRQTRGLAESLS